MIHKWLHKSYLVPQHGFYGLIDRVWETYFVFRKQNSSKRYTCTGHNPATTEHETKQDISLLAWLAP